MTTEKDLRKDETQSLLSLNTPKLSVAEVHKLLNEKLSPSGKVRDFFKPFPIGTRLDEVLYDPAIIEMDFLFLTQQFSSDEFLEYVAFLPDFALARHKMGQIALDLGDAMRVQFDQLLKGERSSNPKKVKSFTALFENLKNLYNKLLYSPEKTKKSGCIRNALLDDFYKKIQIILYLWMEEFLHLPENKNSGISFRWTDNSPGIKVKEQMIYSRSVLANSFYLQQFNSLISYESVNEDQRGTLQKELQEKFALIQMLLEQKEIHTHVVAGINGTQVFWMGDDLLLSGSFSVLIGHCLGTIDLNQNASIKSPKKNSDGSFFFSDDPGCIHFVLAKITGELTFLHAQFLSLETVMSPDQYLFLKKKIYDFLIHYLFHEAPDREFIDLQSDVDNIAEPVSERVRAAMTEENHFDISSSGINQNDFAPATYSTVDFTGMETPSLQFDESLPVSGMESLKRKKYKIARGIKKERLEQILYRLMGDPINMHIGGSHRIYKGPNGKNFPIAIHDSGASYGLLLKCLKEWGITPEIFCKAMAKSPKK